MESSLNSATSENNSKKARMEAENNMYSGMPPGYIPLDVTPQCTWVLGKPSSKSPHPHKPKHNPNVHCSILPNILEMVGNTPLVRLDKIAKSEGLECDLLGKCEFFNAGGSLKDRIGLRMVQEAERDGILHPGDTVIEPTSGNTGIGLALTCAVKGYRCIVCIPERMSNEKIAVLKALGAEIVRTPSLAPSNSPESHVGMAWKLKNEIPNSHILDQYRNPGNPLAHYDGTAEEILAQCGEGGVDMVVIGVGSGGTMSGIGRKLKERLPDVKVIGVDPYGSVMAEPDELNKEGANSPIQVEGIGYDVIPTVLDRSVVDQWYKLWDKETFHYARRLIREEGLLCGGSSGSAVAGAVKAAKSLKAGQKCVVILPDSIRNYITKFVDDKWLRQYGFLESVPPPGAEWWWAQPITVLSLCTPITVNECTTCKQAAEIFHTEKINQMPIVTDGGEVVGAVTVSNTTANIVSGTAKPSDPVTKVIYRSFEKVDASTTLGRLSQLLERDSFAVVMQSADGQKQTLQGIVTNTDLLQYICANAPSN